MIWYSTLVVIAHQLANMINEAWNSIVGWLQSKAVGLELNQPATPEQFARAAAVGLSLPPELVMFYEATDGAESCSVFPSPDEYEDMAFTPMPLDEVILEWQGQNELVEIGQFADRTPRSETGIANDWWNSGWIPFASNGGGDYLCVDTSPADGGNVGQVISHSHETGEHRLLAASLLDYLQSLAGQLADGKYEFDETFGVRLPVPEPEPEDTTIPKRSLWNFKSETIPAAYDAFRNKDYAKCVELLEPFEDVLDKVAMSKLSFARKKCSAER